MNGNKNIIYPELSYTVNGILFEVHNELGRYCNEKQYGDLIEKKLKMKDIKFEREKILPVSFIGEKKGRNKIDFLVENKIILELKCRKMIEKHDFYQLMRYLVAFNIKLGMVINFHSKYLKPKRIINPYYYS